MRAVIQRVSSASVTVDGELTGAIERGLLVLLGVEDGDTEAERDWLLKKVSGQRIFEDEEGRMNLDCAAVDGAFLVVSQFTLFGSTRKGNRPGFSRAAEPLVAEAAYEDFCERLGALSGRPVARGRFAAHMQVALVNDGPVTLVIDSRLKE
jgi:D-tyrosyl-tRNA(Tyr) deacylase